MTKLSNKHHEILYYMDDGTAIFRGTIPPKLHEIFVILSSHGFTDEEIAAIIDNMVGGG